VLAQVRGQVLRQERSQVRGQDLTQVLAQDLTQVLGQGLAQVLAQVWGQVLLQVWGQVLAQVWGQGLGEVLPPRPRGRHVSTRGVVSARRQTKAEVRIQKPECRGDGSGGKRSTRGMVVGEDQTRSESRIQKLECRIADGGGSQTAQGAQLFLSFSGLTSVYTYESKKMSRRKRYPSHHENPHEQRLRMIVSLYVPDGPERQAYLAFARELMRSIHRDPVPDYEPGTKRVVQKWFERGLHGHLLWLVGQAVIREVRMTKSE